MSTVYNRERYAKSPLVEVIYQLRFPTILSINNNTPDDFQERIREQYPFYNEQMENQGELIIDFKKGPELSQHASIHNYNFVSVDKQYKINLTSSFISISTMAYTQWEDFKRHIDFVIPIFEEIYKPSFYIRVGLRYVNIINKEEVGLQDIPWNKLINPRLLGMMDSEHEAGTKSYVSQIEYETNVEDVLSTAHFELVRKEGTNDLGFLIDCDYYKSDVTNSSQVNNVSEMLHTASSSFIRSIITEELRQAMGPTEIK